MPHTSIAMLLVLGACVAPAESFRCYDSCSAFSEKTERCDSNSVFGCWQQLSGSDDGDPGADEMCCTLGSRSDCCTTSDQGIALYALIVGAIVAAIAGCGYCCCRQGGCCANPPAPRSDLEGQQAPQMWWGPAAAATAVPVAQAQVVQAPVVQAQVVQAPAVPVAQAQVVQAPVAQAPVVQAQVVEPPLLPPAYPASGAQQPSTFAEKAAWQQSVRRENPMAAGGGALDEAADGGALNGAAESEAATVAGGH